MSKQKSNTILITHTKQQQKLVQNNILYVYQTNKNIFIATDREREEKTLF